MYFLLFYNRLITMSSFLKASRIKKNRNYINQLSEIIYQSQKFKMLERVCQNQWQANDL